MDMKRMNTFGIQFIIRVPKQQKNEKYSVYARITVNGRRSKISLKTKVLPKNWDEGKAKGKPEDVIKLNNHIERVHSLITRSEERRVGKECRSRWWRYDSKKEGSVC